MTTPATDQTPDWGQYRPVDVEGIRVYARETNADLTIESCLVEITYLRAQVARQDAAIGELVVFAKRSYNFLEESDPLEMHGSDYELDYCDLIERHGTK